MARWLLRQQRLGRRLAPHEQRVAEKLDHHAHPQKPNESTNNHTTRAIVLDKEKIMNNTTSKDKVLRVVEVAIEVVGLIIMLLPLVLGRGKTK